MPPIELKRHYYVKDIRTPAKGECCTLGGDVRVRDLVCSLQLGTPRGTLGVRLIFVRLTSRVMRTLTSIGFFSLIFWNRAPDFTENEGLFVFYVCGQNKTCLLLLEFVELVELICLITPKMCR